MFVFVIRLIYIYLINDSKTFDMQGYINKTKDSEQNKFYGSLLQYCRWLFNMIP